jgi:hypothetical protein
VRSACIRVVQIKPPLVGSSQPGAWFSSLDSYVEASTIHLPFEFHMLTRFFFSQNIFQGWHREGFISCLRGLFYVDLTLINFHKKIILRYCQDLMLVDLIFFNYNQCVGFVSCSGFIFRQTLRLTFDCNIDFLSHYFVFIKS